MYVLWDGHSNPDEDTVFWDMMLCRLVCRYYLSNLAFLIWRHLNLQMQHRVNTQQKCYARWWGSPSSDKDFQSSGISCHVQWYAGMYFQYTILVLILNSLFILKVQIFKRVYSNCDLMNIGHNHTKSHKTQKGSSEADFIILVNWTWCQTSHQICLRDYQ